MTVQMTIELATPQAAQIIVRAIDLYKTQLQINIERTQRKLNKFERQYNVSTTYFLSHMTAEDLTGGDLEYVEWAGEAKLLTGLQSELEAMEYAHYHLP